MTNSDRPVRDWPRWATAIVFVLAGLALTLPAVSFRVDFTDGAGGHIEVTYSGLDPAVNGRAEAWSRSRDESGRWREQRAVGPFLDRADPSARAAGLLALVVLALGAATATLRGRVRAGAALGAALLAALALTASMTWTKDAMASPYVTELIGSAASPADHLEYRYGFWLVLGLLAVTAAANLLAVVTRPASPARPISAPASA